MEGVTYMKRSCVLSCSIIIFKMYIKDKLVLLKSWLWFAPAGGGFVNLVCLLTQEVNRTSEDEDAESVCHHGCEG